MSERMNYTAVRPKRYSKELGPVGAPVLPESDAPGSTRVVKTSVLSMIAASFLILFVIYGDGLAILSELPILTNNAILQYDDTNNVSSVGIGNFKLGLPKLVFLFFNAGGVFNRVPDNNIEYALYGRRVGADPGKPWEDLSYIKDCFPYDGRGEVYDRLSFPWHTVMGQAAQTTAMQNLLAKIKEKYNREHPESQIDKIAIYMSWWPWSEDGFYKNKQPGTTQWQIMAQD